MTQQTWGYRWKDGEVQSQIFDGDLPKGWVDSPAKVKAPKRKAKDGDDA